jgi:hypothetical protein
MALNSEPQVSPDVEEQKELSTSSEDNNTGSEATDNETTEGNEEPQTGEEAKADTPEESTETKVKKPRRRKVDAEIRAVEDRIMNAVEKRLSQSTAPSDPSGETSGSNAQASDPNVQLFTRKYRQFGDELDSFRKSSDSEERAIAQTIDDMIGNRNALSDIDLSVKQQLVMDGITPEELHDLNVNFGDKLVPQAPQVEYRTIKRYLRQIRNGQVGKPAAKTPTARKPQTPISQVAGGGGGGGMRREQSAADIAKRMMGG